MQVVLTLVLVATVQVDQHLMMGRPSSSVVAPFRASSFVPCMRQMPAGRVQARLSTVPAPPVVCRPQIRRCPAVWQGP